MKKSSYLSIFPGKRPWWASDPQSLRIVMSSAGHLGSRRLSMNREGKTVYTIQRALIIDNKKVNSTVEKWAEHVKRHFTEEQTLKGNKHENKLNQSGSQRNIKLQ